MDASSSAPGGSGSSSSNNNNNNSQYSEGSAKKVWPPRKNFKKREHSPDKEWNNKSKSPPRNSQDDSSATNGPSTSFASNGPSTSFASNGPSTSYPSNGPSTSTFVPNGPSTSTFVPNGPSTSTYVPNGPSTSTFVPNGPSTSSYPANGYANSENYYAVDPNQSNYIMPQYNMYNTLNQWNASVSSSMPNMDMASTSTGMNPYPYVVPADPSMFQMMAPMPTYCPMPMMNGGLPAMQPPPKVTKTFPNCTLVPPPPGAPPPSRRQRPNGCKTVFVGGLPEKITEEIIKEAFSDCGEISTVRMSKKNFCHIRFTSEHMVDQAMHFSGYRIKVENRDESSYASRLHVDFAIARDDQYEYECMLRTMSREARHASDDFRAPSPPPIVNYSECEAATVGENLRNEETFRPAIDVLIAWLDRGECNKRNAGTFYSMIQSTYSHVRRLVAEKTRIEDELTAVRNRLHQQSTSNAAHFTDIERVFRSALTQKVWDHFTKAQRKHIDQWKKQTVDTKMQNLEDLLEERIEDEMEMSDSEEREAPEEPDKTKELKEEMAQLRQEHTRLQEESEMLRAQMRSANERRNSEKEMSDTQKQALETTYALMQRNYLDTKKELEEAKREIEAAANREQNLFELASGGMPTSVSVTLPQLAATSDANAASTSAAVSVNENEARLIALISTFLNVHPLGASIDYICSYLATHDRNVNTRDVEILMRKFKTVFKEISTGIGATLEKKWTLFAYQFYTSAHF